MAEVMDEAEAQSAYAFMISFVTITTFIVALRIHVKWNLVGNIGPDDFASFASLISAIGTVIALCLNFRHQTIPDHDEKELGKIIYIGGIFYYNSLFFTKLSLVLQYLKIFRTKKTHIVMWISTALIIVYGAWTIFSTIFICQPISGFWDKSVKHRCIDILIHRTLNTSLNIATNLLIILLPLPGIKRLILPLSQRLSLMFIFALGGLVCMISILRLWSLYHGPADGIVGGRYLAEWLVVEVTVAIICSCLPTLRPLIVRMFSNIKLNRKTPEKVRTYMVNKFARQPTKTAELEETERNTSPSSRKADYKAIHIMTEFSLSSESNRPGRSN